MSDGFSDPEVSSLFQLRILVPDTLSLLGQVRVSSPWLAIVGPPRISVMPENVPFMVVSSLPVSQAGPLAWVLTLHFQEYRYGYPLVE